MVHTPVHQKVAVFAKQTCQREKSVVRSDTPVSSTRTVSQIKLVGCELDVGRDLICGVGGNEGEEDMQVQRCSQQVLLCSCFRVLVTLIMILMFNLRHILHQVM